MLVLLSCQMVERISTLKKMWSNKSQATGDGGLSSAIAVHAIWSRVPELWTSRQHDRSIICALKHCYLSARYLPRLLKPGRKAHLHGASTAPNLLFGRPTRYLSQAQSPILQMRQT